MKSLSKKEEIIAIKVLMKVTGSRAIEKKGEFAVFVTCFLNEMAIVITKVLGSESRRIHEMV